MCVYCFLTFNQYILRRIKYREFIANYKDADVPTNISLMATLQGFLTEVSKLSKEQGFKIHIYAPKLGKHNEEHSENPSKQDSSTSAKNDNNQNMIKESNDLESLLLDQLLPEHSSNGEFRNFE